MRLIDADTLKNEMCEDCSGDCTRACTRDCYEVQLIKAQPTIEAEPVRRGKWLHTEDYITISGQCSECGWVSAVGETDVAGMPYCPNCGAKMEE